MIWNFATADGKTKLSLREGNAQTFGHLTHDGVEHFVMGNTPRGNPVSVDLHNAECSGRFVASGDSQHPTSLQFTGTVPGPQGGSEQLNIVMLPVPNTRIEDIVDAYRRSFAVLRIEGTHDTPRCTQAWQGGKSLTARDGVIGPTVPVGFDYDSDPANTAIDDATKSQICRPDAEGNFVVHVPKLSTMSGKPGPVLIQIMGETDHFANPPFAEPHDQIVDVYQEEYKRQCLTIEYSNEGPPEKLVFNDGHKRSHRSIIIQPR